MTTGETPAEFDVNGPGLPDKLFGLPFTEDTARLIILPVPWEATVSYHTGTARAPQGILSASRQVDIFHPEIPDAWKLGVAMTEFPASLLETSDNLRVLVNRTHETEEDVALLTEKVNEGCGSLHIYTQNLAKRYLKEGKIVGMVGGDHSTPLGLIRALGENHNRFGILQVDAHADLRKAYEGFQYSHASIMYNALKTSAVSKLVQVGIRDLCEAEHDVIVKAGGRIRTFFDEGLKRSLDSGKSWSTLCQEIVNELPQAVYISFDIDGLDPRYCPGTGTPVPGGLEFFQAVELIRAIALSGRTIIGFDLNEVGPTSTTDWDANVGARLLWQLSCWTGVSQKLLSAVRHSD